MDWKPLTVKVDDSVKSPVRQIFVKHLDADDLESPQNILQVINVPIYVNEAALRHLFAQCGKIEDIRFTPTLSDIPSSGIGSTSKFFKDEKKYAMNRVAHIYFADSEGPKAAIQLDSDEERVIYPSGCKYRPLFGLQKMMKDYNDSIFDPQEVQKEIDEYMAEYDRQKGQLKKQAIQAQEPDEDGWIKVTRHGKTKNKVHQVDNYNPNKVNLTKKQKLRGDARRKKMKKMKKEDSKFYKFTVRDEKMSRISSLQKKFEEDKKRLATIKQDRKFKPE